MVGEGQVKFYVLLENFDEEKLLNNLNKFNLNFQGTTKGPGLVHKYME